MSSCSFNPCFNGSVERGVRRRPTEWPTDAVSILVLMEVLREATTAWRGNRALLVSILVLMEVLREAAPCRESAERDCVSILVLMEVLREVKYLW